MIFCLPGAHYIMAILQSLKLMACLAASTAYFSVIGLAKPIDNNLPHPSAKAGAVTRAGRTILWEWTLTRDLNDVINATAASLEASSLITSVTNWETWRPPEIPVHIPFRPMLRTPAQLEGGDWANLLTSLSSPGTGRDKVVHFYSEPERQGIAPAAAAEAWRQSMVPLRDWLGVKLVAPACAADEAGTRWLDEFMDVLSASNGNEGEDRDRQAAGHLTPDYLGLHFYGDQRSSADEEIAAAKAYIAGRHERHGLDVVIVELASTSRDGAVVDRFSKEVGAWLDEQSWVLAYGLFGVERSPVNDFISPAAQLLDAEGRWTELGRWFTGVGP